MLAHDRRVLDVPLEERLQSRTSELLAWAKTMLPIINRGIRDARVQLQTGHQDLRSYSPQATVATTDHRAATPTVRDARAQLQNGHQDLRRYFSQATVATTDHTAATPTVASPAHLDAPPPGHPTALSEHRRQYPFNPLGINKQSCTYTN
jgi:hypothetical protein